MRIARSAPPPRASEERRKERPAVSQPASQRQPGKQLRGHKKLVASNERLSATLTTVGTKNVIRWHCARRYSSLRWRVHDGTLFIERLAQKRAAHSWLLSNYALATQRSRFLLSSPLLSSSPCSLCSLCSSAYVVVYTSAPTNPTNLSTYLPTNVPTGNRTQPTEKRREPLDEMARGNIARAVPTHGESPAAHQGRRRPGPAHPTMKTSSEGIRRRFP